MMPQFLRRVLKWRYAYRSSVTGRYISRAEYDRLPEADRIKHRIRT
jgi:hypothetical protein